MKIVSFAEFRRNASIYVDLVENGVEVHIRRQGKIVARLVPGGDVREPAWRKPGLKLVTQGPSLSKAILDSRR